MFYDRAKIYIKSGNGGDGMIGFRREKHVPLGGPNGGDGGKGGDIIIVVNAHYNSLIRFHRNNHYRAGDASHGSLSRKTGAGGEIQLTDAIAQDIGTANSVYGYRFHGQRFDCGSKAGFLQATVS